MKKRKKQGLNNMEKNEQERYRDQTNGSYDFPSHVELLSVVVQLGHRIMHHLIIRQLNLTSILN